MIAISVDRMAEALKESRGNITKAAESIGVNRTSIYRRLKGDPDLQAIVDEAREFIVLKAEDNVFERVEEGDQKASEFVLKTIGRHRGWVSGTELSGSVDTKAELHILRVPNNRRGIKGRDTQKARNAEDGDDN